jgi:hypothetical protein
LDDGIDDTFVSIGATNGAHASVLMDTSSGARVSSCRPSPPETESGFSVDDPVDLPRNFQEIEFEAWHIEKLATRRSGAI